MLKRVDKQENLFLEERQSNSQWLPTSTVTGQKDYRLIHKHSGPRNIENLKNLSIQMSFQIISDTNLQPVINYDVEVLPKSGFRYWQDYMSATKFLRMTSPQAELDMPIPPEDSGDEITFNGKIGSTSLNLVNGKTILEPGNRLASHWNGLLKS